jgi:hypothetical protein
MTTVSQIKYLGALITADARPDEEIHNRIEQARKAFFNTSQVFYSPDIDNDTKVLVYKALVRPILTYQLQSIGSVGLNPIMVFDRSCLQRLIRGYDPPSENKPYWTLWSNEKVHEITKTEAIELFIRRQRLKWAGHVARKPEED